MKLQTATWSICATLLAIASSHAAVTVDGIRDVGEAYTLVHTQATQSGWNTPNESLANLYAKQEADTLYLHLAGKAGDGVLGNSVILFLDTKPGGVNKITNNLITSGGEEAFINNLGTSPTTGLTFESGFSADYAIRIYGNNTDAYVNIYDLNAGTRTSAGNSGAGVISSDLVTSLRTVWTEYLLADYATANQGVEMALDLAKLGVGSGPQTVKMTAILVNHNSTYGSNQVLGSRTTSTTDIASGINAIDFEALAEPEIQTLSFGVTGPDFRNVTFSVNMKVQLALGTFNPATETVVVDFFDGLAGAINDFPLTDSDNDGIYTGTLSSFQGAAGADSGGYKFKIIKPGDDLFENSISNRSFTLGAANVTQVLPTVYFDNSSTLSYSAWSTANSGGLAADQDSDGDGVSNGIEYFMGEIGNSFTANPQPIGGIVTWPRSSIATGVSFEVWKSDNLTTWQDDTAAADTSNSAFVKYTLTPGDPKKFVRFAVTVP